MTWVSLALALLKFAESCITWARERELVSVGQDKEIAATTAAILLKSEFAKNTMEQMAELTPEQTDDVLKQLEGS